MGLYLRGKSFWMTYMYQGKRIQRSLDTDNKREAEKRCSKIIKEIVEDDYFETEKLKRISFDEMIEKYLQSHAKQRDGRTSKTLLLFFTGYTLHQITTKIISEYRQTRLKKVKPATVYQELALLRRMFNIAIKEWEWCRDNPVSKLSFSVGNRNARDRWLTLDEEKRLIDLATNPAWLRNLLMLALHTGMRRGEILDLKWSDIDLKRRIIMVMKSKNNEKRTIPMSNTLYTILRDISIVDISGRIFPISGSSLRQAFDQTVVKAKINNFRFHDLRHTFATRLVQNGVDLYKVKELLGHKTVTMTMRYAHHYPESLRSSVAVLDECYNFTTILGRVIDQVT